MNPQLEKERARRAQALQHRLYDQQLTRLGLSNATDRPPSRSSDLETIKSLHASQLRPPPGVDPPKDVLAAARHAVRRLG